MQWEKAADPSDPSSGGLYASVVRLLLLVSGFLLVPSVPAAGEGIEVVVTFQNLSEEELHISSPWIGFQNGEFDLYDPDSGPITGLERLTSPCTLRFSGWRESGSSSSRTE